MSPLMLVGAAWILVNLSILLVTVSVEITSRAQARHEVARSAAGLDRDIAPGAMGRSTLV